MSKSKSALALFNSGFNCSQSVCAAYAVDLGMQPDDALRVAAAFGGGIGRTGGMCGAVSGALMVLGMKYGMTVADGAKRERMYAIAQEFMKRFAGRRGTLVCNDLVGADIRTAEGRQSMKERNTHATVCSHVIEDAAGILDEMLKEDRVEGRG